MNPTNLMFGEKKNWDKKIIDKPHRAEFGLLISAAIVSKKFRNLLLTNPHLAIDKGYNNQPFFFSDIEKHQICSIVTKSFKEFSAKIYLLGKDFQSEYQIENTLFETSSTIAII